MMQRSCDIPQELIENLRAANKIAILTGAGMSAESGIPTFRDALTGLWSQYNPEDLATPQAFEHHPRLVWEWYSSRRSLVRQVSPNQGHQALAAMERVVPTVTVITQNVDGLHQKAGSSRVLELHGNIHRVKCSQEGTIVGTWEETGTLPPRCPHCQALLRPDAVWFGEPLPQEPLLEAAEAVAACDVFFSIGTSGQVYPAASFVHFARRSHAEVVIMNTDEKAQDFPDFHRLNGPAGQILPELLQTVWPQM
ncbi:SIR2 family NAD-dependent protein deacylase [Ktedonospora formicarum]|uniref:NAD-dependent protein deacylase n=1 Tax=Ktedonospora formicarum TaxID=2778364 RepID=A0A8J3HR15_9CHLR|nr:NAD-dependent deacylase [Ktedonospora formicarum]GHO42257.1 NAD-dependent protein deacylase [Ktedonospora formicarum]